MDNNNPASGSGTEFGSGYGCGMVNGYSYEKGSGHSETFHIRIAIGSGDIDCSGNDDNE